MSCAIPKFYCLMFSKVPILLSCFSMACTCALPSKSVKGLINGMFDNDGIDPRPLERTKAASIEIPTRRASLNLTISYKIGTCQV